MKIRWEHNIIKSIYDKRTASIILSDKKLNNFKTPSDDNGLTALGMVAYSKGLWGVCVWTGLVAHSEPAALLTSDSSQGRWGARSKCTGPGPAECWSLPPPPHNESVHSLLLLLLLSCFSGQKKKHKL